MKDKIKKEIKGIVQEVFDDYFNVEIVIDKGARKPGDHEHVIEKENVPLLPFIARYLPQIEGRMAGMQETLDHVKNINAETRDRLETLEKQVGTMADIIFQHQEEVTLLTKFVGKLGDMGFLEDIKDKLQPKVIELNPEGQKRIES